MNTHYSHKQETFLVARFCAPDSFDLSKMMRHVNLKLPRVGYADLKSAYTRLYNEIIHKQRRPEEIAVFTPETSGYLDFFDKHNNFLLIDVFVTNFDIFYKFCMLVKERYNDLKIVFIMDDPLKYFNSFCHSLNRNTWINSCNYFFNYQLYRLDKLFNNTEKCVGKKNIFIISSKDRQENERSLFALINQDYSDALASVPFPVSFQGHELNVFIGLPTWFDTVSLEEWRAYINKWEYAGGIRMTRVPEPDHFRHLEEQLDRYCRYVKKRYPELENILNINAETYCELDAYDGLTADDMESFVKSIPEETQKKLGKAFTIIRRGLPGFYNNFFTQIDKATDIRVGDDLSIPKCAVITFAYNHEKYIAQCMDSVRHQNLDCSMEHIVVDDASSDDTPKIISAYCDKYPHIKPILFKSKPPNPISTAFQSCKSQYVALCDGDDYFSDNGKLKKQIDFLDRYAGCGLCFHYTEVFFEDGRASYVYPPPAALPGGVKHIYSIEDLLQGNLMQTSSVMYRWRFREGLPKWFKPNLLPGDWYWHLLHAECGQIGFIPEIMSRYRRHTGSVYESADKDTVEHRIKHGLKELEMYQHCDEHFNLKYHASFTRLATGVFTNFVQSFSSTGSSELLDRASVLYPAFARDFLLNLKIVNKSNVAEEIK